MNIRLARAEDAPDLLEIYKPYVSETAVSFETGVPSVSEFADRIRDTLSQFPWLVAEIDGRAVGYAYAVAHRARKAYDWSVDSTVYIGNGFRGRGIGRALYSRLFELLKEQGVANVFAGITQPNEASVRLHESLGFVRVGLFKDVGFKLGKWWDVGWWQLQLQKPDRPKPIRSFSLP